MNYGQCKGCFKSITYFDLPVCNECLDKYFNKIKEYIYENGIKTPQEIKNATSVPLKVINYFIENGSLDKVNREEETKDTDKIERYKQLLMLNDLKNSLQGNKKDTINNNSNQHDGMHYIGRKGR